MADTIDMGKLEAAIVSWTNPRGRPKRGTAVVPKWEAIDDVAASVGLAHVAPESIQEDWARYLKETIGPRKVGAKTRGFS